MTPSPASATPTPRSPIPTTGAPVTWPDGTVIDGVAVLRWPEEAATRATLDADGATRLLLVADEAVPPLVWSDREDWARAGASPTELRARVDRLAALPPAAGRHPTMPVLDAHGVLHLGDGELVVIPPVEARVLARLLDDVGSVVRRADLGHAAWPTGEVGERALDGRIKLLRRRIAGRGITIHTVRGLGYLLELDR